MKQAQKKHEIQCLKGLCESEQTFMTFKCVEECSDSTKQKLYCNVDNTANGVCANGCLGSKHFFFFFYPQHSTNLLCLFICFKKKIGWKSLTVSAQL